MATKNPAQLIDERINELGDWRGTTLARIRKLIKQADSDVVEEWKWSGVPVWEPASTETPGAPSTFAKTTRSMRRRSRRSSGPRWN
jgi:hypothetical protein